MPAETCMALASTCAAQSPKRRLAGASMDSTSYRNGLCPTRTTLDDRDLGCAEPVALHSRMTQARCVDELQSILVVDNHDVILTN